MRCGERPPLFQDWSSLGPPVDIGASLVGILMPPLLLGGAMSWDCQAEDRERRKGRRVGKGRSGLVTGRRGLACWRQGRATGKKRGAHTTRRRDDALSGHAGETRPGRSERGDGKLKVHGSEAEGGGASTSTLALARTLLVEDEGLQPTGDRSGEKRKRWHSRRSRAEY